MHPAKLLNYICQYNIYNYIIRRVYICAVEVVIGGGSWCLTGIYRPHADSPENFTYMIEQILENNKLRNINCIILGEINFLLENSVVDEFVATMR